MVPNIQNKSLGFLQAQFSAEKTIIKLFSNAKWSS